MVSPPEIRWKYEQAENISYIVDCVHTPDNEHQMAGFCLGSGCGISIHIW